MGKVKIVGIGLGDESMCTVGAREALAGCDVIAGGARLLDAAESIAGEGASPARVEQISPRAIREALDGMEFDTACIVCSGDTGFYSLASTIRGVLDGYEVETIPGIATVQYMAAKLGRPWQDCTLRSAHGKSCNILGEVLSSPEVFFLTGGDIVPRTIAEELDAAGLGDVEMAVGERLSYPDERVVVDRAAAFVGVDFDSLSAVWIRHGDLRSDELDAYPCLTSGIPDEAFVRGKVPMTKQEVRAVSMAKLQVAPGDVVYDIGAGTGSVSIEAALASPMCRVYSIEVNPDGCALIDENRRRFGAYNVSVVEGTAPGAIEGLPAPDAVFIGGTKGNMSSIIERVLELNPRCRIVATAVTMETIEEAQRVFSELASQSRIEGFEVAEVSVNRTREVGRYHMLSAQNPIFIFSARGSVPSGAGN